jgi:hypothetical protein
MVARLVSAMVLVLLPAVMGARAVTAAAAVVVAVEDVAAVAVIEGTLFV